MMLNSKYYLPFFTLFITSITQAQEEPWLYEAKYSHQVPLVNPRPVKADYCSILEMVIPADNIQNEKKTDSSLLPIDIKEISKHRKETINLCDSGNDSTYVKLSITNDVNATKPSMEEYLESYLQEK